jgi:surface antigen
MATVDAHHTRWSATDAVNFVLAEAEKRSQSWHRLCLNLCAKAYGYMGSGTKDLDHDGNPEAIEYWQSARASYKHPGDRHPPVGALACWKSTTAGHIAVVVRSTGGEVRIASNDIIGNDGDVDVVPLGRIEKDWRGQTYLGWVEPDFPNGAGTNPFGKRKPKEGAEREGKSGGEPNVSLSTVRRAANTSGKADGVLSVQKALKAEYPSFDYSSGPGFFGPRTKEFYSRWQRDQPEHFKGKDADGMPGRLTLERLGAKHGFDVVD